MPAHAIGSGDNMLLRRITKHVKDQNWFAVGIDFMIVVVGVFMGIQAQAWNASNNDRNLERQYLTRLHDEVSGIIEKDKDSVALNLADLERMEELGRYLFQDDNTIDPGSDHCVTLVTAHIYSSGTVVPSAIDELLSTGRILLISNSGVKASIIDFRQSSVRFDRLQEDVLSDRVPLATLYPGLITYGEQWSDAKCAFENMRADARFKNHFFDSISRRRGFVNGVIVAAQNLRITLHRQLDSELGFAH